MKNPIKSHRLALLIGAASLLGATSAQATSIDVSVTGSIEPPACTPVIAGGGVIDYGVIVADTLSTTSYTVLPEKTVTFTINCEAATRVGVATVDNRSASMVPGITTAIGAFNDTYNFGLGTVTDANVGGYVMTMKQGTFTADGTARSTLVSTSSDGSAWQIATFGGVRNNGLIVSWGISAVTGPIAAQVFSGTLGVQAVLNEAAALPLSDVVPLDGSATLELVYL